MSENIIFFAPRVYLFWTEIRSWASFPVFLTYYWLWLYFQLSTAKSCFLFRVEQNSTRFIEIKQSLAFDWGVLCYSAFVYDLEEVTEELTKKQEKEKNKAKIQVDYFLCWTRGFCLCFFFAFILTFCFCVFDFGFMLLYSIQHESLPMLQEILYFWECFVLHGMLKT